MPSFRLPTASLRGGKTIPFVGYGLGTARYKHKDGPLDQDTIGYAKLALKTGFRHMDGAEAYGNEEELGQAIVQSGVSRDSIFLTTKVMKNMGSPQDAIKESLRKLQTSYVDLYLIHSPFESDLETAWLEMEKIHKDGLAKEIGVSNCNESHLQRILKVATIKPAVNQVEWNAYLQQPSLLKFHKENDIVTEGYHVLGPLQTDGPLDSILPKLADKYGKTTNQILLRYTIQMNVVALTTTSKESRMKDALDLDFELAPEDMEEISTVGAQKGEHRKFFTNKFKK